MFLLENDEFLGTPAINPFVPKAPFLYPLKTSETSLRTNGLMREYVFVLGIILYH